MMIRVRIYSISTDRIGDDVHDLCDVRGDELCGENGMEWIVVRKRMGVSRVDRINESRQKTKESEMRIDLLISNPFRTERGSDERNRHRKGKDESISQMIEFTILRLVNPIS